MAIDKQKAIDTISNARWVLKYEYSNLNARVQALYELGMLLDDVAIQPNEIVLS